MFFSKRLLCIAIRLFMYPIAERLLICRTCTGGFTHGKVRQETRRSTEGCSETTKIRREQICRKQICKETICQNPISREQIFREEIRCLGKRNRQLTCPRSGRGACASFL